jgi:peptidoglycan/xylan/chitin deacetylase (PgdA/CDA1 family)
MNLLVLMYHRARAERHGNSPELLDEHFGHVANSYHNVLPGETLSSEKLNVCLTFDDGYFDFYAVVFPLLRKHQLRALLAIPAFHVVESATAPASARLAMDSDRTFADPLSGGFCTWAELEEMAASGLVSIAAHGFTHQRLDQNASLMTEIDSPQSILASRLAQPVDSFVFPFGRCSRRAIRHAKARYRYLFRIGSALNRSWNGRVIYRVDADRMNNAWTLFSRRRLAAYRARYFWNRMRFR